MPSQGSIWPSDSLQGSRTPTTGTPPGCILPDVFGGRATTRFPSDTGNGERSVEADKRNLEAEARLERDEPESEGHPSLQRAASAHGAATG